MSSLHLVNLFFSLEGILFNTGIGQHILKNPLIVDAMVDKVIFIFAIECSNVHCTSDIVKWHTGEKSLLNIYSCISCVHYNSFSYFFVICFTKTLLFVYTSISNRIWFLATKPLWSNFDNLLLIDIISVSNCIPLNEFARLIKSMLCKSKKVEVFAIKLVYNPGHHGPYLQSKGSFTSQLSLLWYVTYSTIMKSIWHSYCSSK